MLSLKDELAKLEKLGVNFFFPLDDCRGSLSSLTVDDICELSEIGDRDKFIIKKLGITIDHLRLWKEFNNHEIVNQCQGITKKGERCKNLLDPYEASSILDFDPEYHMYCRLHKPY